jgi:hypothetical protein
LKITALGQLLIYTIELIVGHLPDLSSIALASAINASIVLACLSSITANIIIVQTKAHIAPAWPGESMMSAATPETAIPK